MLKRNWIGRGRLLGVNTTFEQVFYVGTRFNSG